MFSVSLKKKILKYFNVLGNSFGTEASWRGCAFCLIVFSNPGPAAPISGGVNGVEGGQEPAREKWE